MEAYTIPEAAEATGLSPRAVRTRVEEGELRAIDRDGVRVIPRSELERSGLLALAGGLGGLADGEVRLVRKSPEHAAAVLRELTDRLDAHGAELDALKARVTELEVERDKRSFHREALTPLFERTERRRPRPA